MVWGATSASEKSELVIVRNNLTAQWYIDNYLQQPLIPFIDQHNNSMTFQHDNARPNAANITQQYLNQSNTNVPPWPSMSHKSDKALV